MAKATDTTLDPETVAEGITLSDYEAESAPGIYDAHVLAMLKGDAEKQEKDPERFANKTWRTAATILFTPRIEKRKRGENEEEVDMEFEKVKRDFQDSARNHDRTAKVVNRRPQGDGIIALDFILAPKQVRTRKPVDGDEGDAPTDA